jgi:hypothetical protein
LLGGLGRGAFGGHSGSEPPKLRGEALDGKAIVLPDAAAGKVALLAIGASKKGGDRTAASREHFVADFGSNPRAVCFRAALLQSAPSFIRGMIRSGMRSGTPVAARGYVMKSVTDEAEWTAYLRLDDDSKPAVLLLDAGGRTRWSFNGVFDDTHYQALKKTAAEPLAQ